MDKENDLFFENLYLDNYRELLKYAYRLTYMKNIAEEIVQDAFVEASRKAGFLRRHENAVGWLYAAVKKIAKSYLREIVEMKNHLPLDESILAAQDQESRASFLLSCLTRDEADIVLKFYIQGLSLSEISKGYGASLSACKMRLKRARDKLLKDEKSGI